ncbi:GPP34 family phosphoprotein [Micromonospora sp. NPDC007230]|uniref:GOLPH3/VPS74 family protein n=1 Tax=Micromonospora sp. NPDC007230 TaxID=3364237 RepID=UPI0036BDACAE
MHVHLELIPAPAHRRVRSGPHKPKLLADEFFMLAHDDQSGRPRLPHSSITFGLAAALLAELGSARRIHFERGELTILDQRAPDDWLQHMVLARLIAMSQHTGTRTWLAYLAATSYDLVAQRLWQAGMVKPKTERRMFKTVTVYAPTDMNVAAWSWARLLGSLRNLEPLDTFDLALAGIAREVRLDQWILQGTPHASTTHLRQLLAEAPPPMRDLLAALNAAIGNAVMSHRT